MKVLNIVKSLVFLLQILVLTGVAAAVYSIRDGVSSTQKMAAPALIYCSFGNMALSF